MRQIPSPRDPEIETDDPDHYHVLAEIKRMNGSILVDETMYSLGVAKRTAERWLGGKPMPEPVVERLERNADLVAEFVADLEDLVAEHRDAGLSEHLMRLRLRKYVRTLSDKPAENDKSESSD